MKYYANGKKMLILHRIVSYILAQTKLTRRIRTDNFMDDKDKQIQSLLDTLPPITLEQMESIKLMNRLDTKYVATKRQLIELLRMVQDKYFVQTIGSTTICPYRTTYFDTEDHAMYMMHHNKRARRTKVRVRTYLTSGDLTFLEVKKKNNHGRTKKKRIQVPSLEASKTTEGAAELVQRRTGMAFSSMHQVVQNYFERITLVNKGKTERLTIDFNIRFHNFETGNDADSDQLVIIELKRDGNVYSPISSLLRDLHIHPTGFSKCCIGMVWTDSQLKQNNFKAKVRKLAKINQDERAYVKTV